MDRNIAKQVYATLKAQGRDDLAKAFGKSLVKAEDADHLAVLQDNWTEILRQTNTIPSSVKSLRSLGPERYHFIVGEMLDSLANVLALGNYKEAETLRKIGKVVKAGHKK